MQATHRLIEFRSSGIHGRGGFARSAIAAGIHVIEYVGEKIDKQQSLQRCIGGNHCIFHLDDDWDLDGGVEWNPARLLNHSCSANCEAVMIDDQIWIVACRAIAAGEELTFNYNYDLEDFHEHPCRCSASNCVGFIVAEELFDHVRTRSIQPDN